MLAKKFALGFGIAVILPMLVHYGVSTFTPSPKWGDYHKNAYYADSSHQSKETKAYEASRKIFQLNLFVIAIPVGIIAILLGAFSPIQAIGTGLMFGGIFTLIDGYACYWSELEDWMRFLSLLIAFIVLIYIGYRKLAK